MNKKIRYSLVEYRWIVQSKKANCLIEISLIKLNSYIYTRRFLLYCLIWFIFHYYYYLRVLKSSLYLSSRPLVSIRVAANTHTHVHVLVDFDDLWYLTICSTIVISFYLEYMNTSPPFLRFIVIWCALCHMYIYMCVCI